MLGTVFGGAITTCGAGFMMFFCIRLFTKMATLLTMTIIFSALYSILWFMPILYWWPLRRPVQYPVPFLLLGAANDDMSCGEQKETEVSGFDF